MIYRTLQRFGPGKRGQGPQCGHGICRLLFVAAPAMPKHQTLSDLIHHSTSRVCSLPLCLPSRVLCRFLDHRTLQAVSSCVAMTHSSRPPALVSLPFPSKPCLPPQFQLSTRLWERLTVLLRKAAGSLLSQVPHTQVGDGCLTLFVFIMLQKGWASSEAI